MWLNLRAGRRRKGEGFVPVRQEQGVSSSVLYHCYSCCNQLLCSSCGEQTSLHNQQEWKTKAAPELMLVVQVRRAKVGSTSAAPPRISVPTPGLSTLTKGNHCSSGLAQEPISHLSLLALPWMICLAIGLKPLVAGFLLTPLPSHTAPE